MSNKNYSWIKPGVHAWVEGLVCPVEVEIKSILDDCFDKVYCISGVQEGLLHFSDLHQTEAECLEVMKKKL